VPCGAAIIRDVRVLHGGTPNCTDKNRYLPSVEFASASFRATNRSDKFPLKRSLPHELFQKLSPSCQELCEELVVPEGQALKVGFKGCSVHTIK